MKNALEKSSKVKFMNIKCKIYVELLANFGAVKFHLVAWLQLALLSRLDCKKNHLSL